MTILEAIDARHSVRAYIDRPIEPEKRELLDGFTAEINRESGLDICIVYDDPSGFESGMAHYGGFRGVSSYIVLKGEKTKTFDFDCGYYGEKLVLYAQQIGLNTCWTAMTFNKKRVKSLVPAGQTLCMAIALGYGETQGSARKSKTAADVTDGSFSERMMPGIEAALKAPTAMNQQKFLFYMENDEPHIKVKGVGVHTKVDLGIAAYHFEAATGRKVVL